MPKNSRETNKLSRFIPLLQFGSIRNPHEVLNPNLPDNPGALIMILNNILKTASALAGVYVLINVIIAGYEFISAGGNADKITLAWARIWQSLLGLVVVAGAFIIAGVFGQLVFGDPTAIISPTIYGPGEP